MSHLLLAEKFQQILFNYTESRHAREIHTTVFSPLRAAHLSEAPRRSPRGLNHRPHFKQSRFVSGEQKH